MILWMGCTYSSAYKSSRSKIYINLDTLSVIKSMNTAKINFIIKNKIVRVFGITTIFIRYIGCIYEKLEK